MPTVYTTYILEVHYLPVIGEMLSWFSTGSRYTHWIYRWYTRNIWLDDTYSYVEIDFNGTCIHLYFTGIQPQILVFFPWWYTLLFLQCNCHPPGIPPLFLWYSLHLHQQVGYMPDGHSYTMYNHAIPNVKTLFLYCPRPSRMSALRMACLCWGLANSSITPSKTLQSLMDARPCTPSFPRLLRLLKRVVVNTTLNCSQLIGCLKDRLLRCPGWNRITCI